MHATWQLLLCLWLGLEPGLPLPAAPLHQQQQETLSSQGQTLQPRGAF